MSYLDLRAGLSIVVPFFNEGPNAPISAKKALFAAEKVDFPIEVIVIDDGSTDGVTATDFPKEVRYFKKIHSGRFETREYGLRFVHYPNVLFLDARVWLNPDSLLNLERLIWLNQTSRYWNGDIQTQNKELAIVSIWETLTMIGWGKGINSTKTISFGLADFDRYPKGTGIFLARKDDWLRAIGNVDLGQSWMHPISDDIKLLRFLAKSGDIWIDRKFSAQYQPRIQLSKFLRNAFHRGGVFVDSYWESPTVFGRLVKISAPFALASQVLFVNIFKLPNVIAINFSLFAVITLLFFGYSYNKWKNWLRAFKEGITFIPLFFSFGTGFLIAYLSGLSDRLQKK
jgi:glycosyltransferase involved in cell wall biosynthesis